MRKTLASTRFSRPHSPGFLRLLGAAACCLVLVAVPGLRPANGSGTLRGTVVDPSGAAIKGSTVEIGQSRIAL